MTSEPVTLELQVKDLAGIGRLLSQGRLAKSLSVKESAQELHLQPRQIIAMEAGEFSNFNNAAFVKGHLRACAKLYGLDGDQLVIACESLLPPPKEYVPVVFAASKKDRLGTGRDNRHALLFFAGIVIFFVAIAAVLQINFSVFPYHFMRDAGQLVGSETVADVSVVGEAVPQVSVALPVSENVGSSNITPTNDAMLADVSMVATPVGQSVMTPEQIVDNSVLHIEFIDECWVQIKSGDGKVLHEKIHKKGDVFDMKVNPPVHLWLGRAAAANLSYNGIFVAVPIKPGAQSAQFVIGDELRTGEFE